MITKEAAAKTLIDWHFEIEPELEEVFLLESAPEEPIQLLEVNAATVTTGSVQPFAFAPTEDIPYPVLIAEITPDELETLMASPERLPRGWSLDRATRIPRPKAA